MRLELANAYEEQAGEFEVLRIEAASEAKAAFRLWPTTFGTATRAAALKLTLNI